MTTTAVKERPVIFSAPMVRAILTGQKTMTRRAVKPDPGSNMSPVCIEDAPGKPWQWASVASRRVCPYGAVGERLWVRETFRAIEDPGAEDSEVRRTYRDDDGETHYIVVDFKADAPNRIMDEMGRPEWKSPIHMPRWASRITLEITEVRVQRVQEISNDDAQAEGVVAFDGRPCPSCSPNWGCLSPSGMGSTRCETFMHGYRESFARLWDSINCERGFPWKSSPWVWAITFRRLVPAAPGDGGPR